MSDNLHNSACDDAYPADMGGPADVSSPSRRAFMRRSSQLAVTGTALPFALNLAAMGEASAAVAGDYKALVCVFLYGGNDYGNTVVAYDEPSYDAYSAIRGGSGRAGGGCALARAALAPTLLQPTTPLPDGRQYAFNPAMTALAGLFNSGKAAVQLNVGPLIVPITKAQFNGADRKNYPLPAKLLSHSDQQAVWQSSAAEGGATGWGGRIGDYAIASNGAATFTCISATGNTVFLAGEQAMAYQLSPTGAVPYKAAKSTVYNSTAVKSTVAALISQQRDHLMENEYNKMAVRSIGAEAQVNGALGTESTLSTPFPATGLGDQLKVVARMIAARGSLGVKRQVFFVSMSGFDLHAGLMTEHPDLLAAVSDAMAAFYNATVELGVADQVTSFTASDFGRTLAINGSGVDHGWGSHHIMVGGAVKGKAFYGKAPAVTIGNTAAEADQWHIGQGRLLPSTSVDQYAATFARWFGVPEAALTDILPNLKNFGAPAGRPDYPRDIGFMKT